MADRHDNWPIGCCAVGNCADCLFACCCPCIALPLARSSLDGSECCFNFYCLNGVIIRWLARTAYGIPDAGFMDDCIIPYCCGPCNTNQVYQTIKQFGPVKNGGKSFNNNKWQDPVSTSSCDCGLFCYSLCCNQCAVGTAMKESLGMGFMMGCCCLNCCGSRNLLRYQYRLQGSDCAEECCAPLTYQGCLCCLSCCLASTCWCCAPCVLPLGVIPMVVFLTAQLQEAKTRGGGDNHRYIAGYDTAAPVMAHAVAPPGMNPGAVMPTAQYAPQPGMQPQYGQPGMQPQYGQPGMQPQYGQPGMQPQYGQPGMQPQYGQPGMQPQYGQPGMQPQYGQPGMQPQDAQPGMQPQYAQPVVEAGAPAKY